MNDKVALCGKIHAFDMESSNLKNVSTPPSLMKSLMAGFDVVANHVSLVMFSVLLDLLLWFGPQVRLVKLFEPFFQEMSAMPDMQENGTIEFLRQGAEQLNLLGILRTFPIGIPSLVAGRAVQGNPFSHLLVIEMNSYGFAFVLWLSLIFIGVLIGTFYFSVVAQAALTDRISLREAIRGLPRQLGQILLLTVFWYMLIMAFLFPLTCILSFLLILGIGLGQFPLLIALFFGGIVIWMMIPLFFSPHGIFAQKKPMWESMIQGIRLSRATFSTTGMLILTVVLLSEGLNVLWNIPKDNSWLLIVGIFGHAFIAAGLLAATFHYYRDADQWLNELISQREANQA